MPDSVRNRLLVNADDFGWSRSVNRGVLESHVNGIVTSASVLAGGAGFDNAIEMIRDTPTLSVGVHLNLYRGHSVLPPEQIPSLVDEMGLFPGDWRVTVRRLVQKRIVLSEVEAEFRAAIERVLDAGVTPSHVDSEKHLHLWPSLFDVTCRVAADYGIPRVRIVREPPSLRWVPLGLSALGPRDARVARAVGLATTGQTVGVSSEVVSLELLAAVLARANAESVELVCHPGYVDDEFLELQKTVPNRLVDARERVLATLTDHAAQGIVADAGFELCSVLGQL